MESGVGAVWVRVSLGAYFSDERARCMMMVPGAGTGEGGARRAGWLARRLRRTFGLPRRPALLCQGHLLPPAEPLPTRAPLLQLEAVPPSGRVRDVSRQRDDDDESDAHATRVPAEPLPAPAPGSPASEQDTKPAPDEEVSECDEVDGGGVAPSPSLEEMKRRALALLERHARGARPPRRRRRRVRRRTAASPPASPPAVVRNERGCRRAPRHVRASSPLPAAAAARGEEPPLQ